MSAAGKIRAMKTSSFHTPVPPFPDGTCHFDRGGLPLVFQMVEAAWARYPAGMTIPPHLHSYYQFDVILSGSFVMRIEGTPMRIRAPQGLLIPPLVRHAYDSSVPCIILNFKFHVSPRHWEALGQKFRQVTLSAGLLRLIGDFPTQEPATAPNQLQALATLCLAETLETGSKRVASLENEGADRFRRMLWPLLEQVANEPCAKWTVQGLAVACHFSPGHFTRLFRQVLGLSPQQHLLEAKMRAAANDLATRPELSIKEVSDRAGYAAVHAFTHAFTRMFRISPGEYRRTPAQKM